jgi:hypothetical protein
VYQNPGLKNWLPLLLRCEIWYFLFPKECRYNPLKLYRKGRIQLSYDQMLYINDHEDMPNVALAKVLGVSRYTIGRYKKDAPRDLAEAQENQDYNDCL